MYDRIILLYNRNKHNEVNQLYFSFLKVCPNAYRKIRDIKNDKRLKKIITYWPVGHLYDILTIHLLKKHPSKPELCVIECEKSESESCSVVSDSL